VKARSPSPLNGERAGVGSARCGLPRLESFKSLNAAFVLFSVCKPSKEIHPARLDTNLSRQTHSEK
jgi:hypothetical protein